MTTGEVDPRDNVTKTPKKSSTSWTRFKDPRIVHVARAFGGKDRHSKVLTVKGLRDRRIRLSVPTALQLYVLQDKLGLDQPSKVVDWLLNEAKHDIYQLPPHQMPPIGREGLPLNELLKLKRPSNGLTGLRKDKDPQVLLEGVQRATQMMIDSDEEATKRVLPNLDLINLLKGNSNSSIFNFGLHQTDFFSRSAHSGGHHGVAIPQHEEIQNFNIMATLPSTIYMPLSSQTLVYPPAGLPQYFSHPQKFASAPEIFDPKDIGIQTLMSSCSENPSSSNRYQFFLSSTNNEEKKTKDMKF